MRSAPILPDWARQPYKYVGMTLIILAGLLLAQVKEQGTVKISFEVKNLPEKRAKDLVAAMKKVAAVKDCTIAGKSVAILVKVEEWAQLSNFNKAVDDLKEGEIDYDTVTLEGRVALGFLIPENTSKILPALKSMKNVTKASAIDKNENYDLIIKSPGIKILDLYLAICNETGWEEARVKEIINDVAWYGGDKKGGDSKPIPRPGG